VVASVVDLQYRFDRGVFALSSKQFKSASFIGLYSSHLIIRIQCVDVPQRDFGISQWCISAFESTSDSHSLLVSVCYDSQEGKEKNSEKPDSGANNSV
ncbi:hypothetical protein PENTCL1PPCAC_29898, partial [Pristionchus entomophagus]